MLESDYHNEGLAELLRAFQETLPKDYQKGFITVINSCVKNLAVPQEIVVQL